MNRDQIEIFMKNFPPVPDILAMDPEDLGAHMLRYMTRVHAEMNRFNFMLLVPSGAVAERFMEAWGWLEREGFLAHRPNDMNGHSFFVTRAGQRVAAEEPSSRGARHCKRTRSNRLAARREATASRLNDDVAVCRAGNPRRNFRYWPKADMAVFPRFHQ
jgi:hypothetical protein